jgi:hypothetical protein
MPVHTDTIRRVLVDLSLSLNESPHTRLYRGANLQRAARPEARRPRFGGDNFGRIRLLFVIVSPCITPKGARCSTPWSFGPIFSGPLPLCGAYQSWFDDSIRRVLLHYRRSNLLSGNDSGPDRFM